ncbi:MAG: Holliday junction resolvase RuvX [Ignavibacteriae bacterium]|nr:Holliday junction resolvase RuvX [Ignavibacteriota bacterium]
MEENSKYLGIDFGLKRIGIAISDTGKKFSFYRDYVLNNPEGYGKIVSVILYENVTKLIIGYPLNFKSEKTEITLSVEQFCSELKSLLAKENKDIEIVFFDERFSSSLAQENLIQSGLSKKKRRDKGIVDSIAAKIILQDYLDSPLKK